MFASPLGIATSRAAGAGYAKLCEDDAEEQEDLRLLTPRFVISEEDAEVLVRRSYSLTLHSAWNPRARTSTFLSGDDVTAFSSGKVTSCNPCCCPTLPFRNKGAMLGIYKARMPAGGFLNLAWPSGFAPLAGIQCTRQGFNSS
jgi:hypothetical protein